MAFPTIPTVAAGRIITGVQANATSPRTFPSLTGLTKNNGDLLVAIIVCYQSSITSNIFSSWGAGFTELKDIGVASQHCVGIAYKWSDGTETGTFTVVQNGTITGHAAMVVLSIPGAHASAAPEVLSALATGTSAAADPASLSPSWGALDTLWIAIAGNGETGTTGSFTGIASAPTNYSNYADTGISSDVIGGVEAAVAFRQLNAASDDVGTFSVDTSNARNCAIVVAVRPVPAATTVNGSFTADAIIRREQSASFTADAILKAPISASFTANAVIRRLDQPGSFTADAIIRREQSASFTADAILRKERTGSFTLDAAIAVEIWNDSFSRTDGPVVPVGYLSGPYGAPYSVDLTSFFAELSIDGSVLSHTAVGTGQSNREAAFRGLPILLEGGEVQFDFLTPADISDLAQQDFIRWHTSTRVSDDKYQDALVIQIWDDSPPLMKATFWESDQGAAQGTITPEADTWYTAKAHFSGTDGTPIYAKVWKRSDPEPGWGWSANQIHNLGSLFFALNGFKRFNGVENEWLPTPIDNIIVRTSASFRIEASFTADAVLRREQSATFTADAIVRKEQVGSFTLDACIATRFTRDTFSRTVALNNSSWGVNDDGSIRWDLVPSSVLPDPGDESLSVDGSVGKITPVFSWNYRFRGYPVLRHGSFQFDWRFRTDTEFGELANIDVALGQADPLKADYLSIQRSGAGALRVFNYFGDFAEVSGLVDGDWVRVQGHFHEIDGTPTVLRIWKVGDTEPRGTNTESDFGVPVTNIDGPIALFEMVGVHSAALEVDNFEWWTSDGTIWTKFLTADAILRKERIASFTADAYFAETIEATFTADAVIRRTQQASLTADAVLLRAQSATFTTDAIVRKEQVASLIADAILRGERTGSFTLDALIVEVIWSDAFTRATLGSPDIGGGYAQALGTSIVDGSTLEAITETTGIGDRYGVDGGRGAAVGLVQFDFRVPDDFAAGGGVAVLAGYIGATVFFGSSPVATARDTDSISVPFSPSAGEWWTVKSWMDEQNDNGQRVKVWKRTEPEPDWQAFANDYAPGNVGGQIVVVNRPPNANQLLLDNVLVRMAQGPVWTMGQLSADAIVRREQSASFTANAVIRRLDQPGSYTADAVILRATAATFTVDAYLIIRIETGLTGDAVIRREQSASFTVDAFVAGAGVAAISADAVIKRTQEHTFVADAVVSRTASATVSADAVIRATLTAGLTANAVIRKTVEASYTADAVLLATRMAGFVADAVVLSPRTSSLTADAIVLRTSSATFTADAFIVSPVTVTAGLTADAVLRATSSNLVTADAVLQATSPKTLTADAVVRRTGSATFTIDAVITEAIDHFAISATISYDAIHARLDPVPPPSVNEISATLSYAAIHAEIGVGHE